jgi:hypothetical protein
MEFRKLPLNDRLVCPVHTWPVFRASSLINFVLSHIFIFRLLSAGTASQDTKKESLDVAPKRKRAISNFLATPLSHSFPPHVALAYRPHEPNIQKDGTATVASKTYELCMSDWQEGCWGQQLATFTTKKRKFRMRVMAHLVQGAHAPFICNTF